MWAFQGKLYVGKAVEALEVAMNWKDRNHTVWTDNFKIEGGVGSAMVWWERAHTLPPWSG